MSEIGKMSSSNLILNNRKSLNLTGVKDIGKFDDKNVNVVTSQGELNISGENLKIEKICVESGNLNLNGKVNSISYSDSKNLGKNFLKKLFS